MSPQSLLTLAELCQGKLVGSADEKVSGICSVEHPEPSCIAFVNSGKASQLIDESTGCLYIVKPQWQTLITNGIVHDNPQQAYRLIVDALFSQSIIPTIAQSAQIDATAVIGENCFIGHCAVIEADAVIGDNCCIGHHAVVKKNCQLGKGTVIENHVTIDEGCRIGEFCHIGTGSVIGGPGFGFSFEGGQWYPVAQLGRVIMGDYCRIGANCCIDRGAINDTILGNNVIIDNLVHIGHNVEIGNHSALAAFVGVSGSAKIGQYCLFGGQAGVVGHITIADGVQINGGSKVLKSIEQPGRYSGVLPALTAQRWNRLANYFTKLDEVFKWIKSERK